MVVSRTINSKKIKHLRTTLLLSAKLTGNECFTVRNVCAHVDSTTSHKGLRVTHRQWHQ